MMQFKISGSARGACSLSLLVLLSLLAQQSLSGEQQRPNIVFIFADDLGYGDLACYRAESKVPTPNLDKLAAGGMRFTQAYCPVSVCSPSRYALMTGRYPFRSWKKNGVLANWERPMIQSSEITLPSMLRQAGYATAAFGKWHLGANYKTTDGQKPIGAGQFKSDNTGANIDLESPIAGGPTDLGFERWYGFICASEMLIFEGSRAAALLSHSLYKPPAVPGVKALPSITVAQSLPLLTDKSIAYVRDRAANGAGKPFFLYFAPYVPHIPLAVGDEFRGRTKAGDYGDYVHQLDHEIGRLLKALEETRLDGDTLVLFASDNGSDFEVTGASHRPNGELRGTKHEIYEGGVRTPLIARWPGHVPAQAVNSEIVALTDMIATLAALTGQKPPAGASDSYNILPLLLGQKNPEPIRSEVITQSSANQFALRQGKWKFVQEKKKGSGGELYDLESDAAEKHNLIGNNQKLAADMRERLKTLMSSPRTAP